MEPININLIYDSIISKLKSSNYLDVIGSFEDSSAGAATGSEALMEQGSFLLSLRHSNPSAYKLIEDEVIEYVNYCKQHGLIIRQS
jgi:hypothetical protein